MISSIHIETPLGTMIACATDTGICLLEFTDMQTMEKDLESISSFFKEKIIPGSNPHLDILKKQLDTYFNRQLKEFSVPLHLSGTSFQQTVWKQLLKIPFSTTRSYISIAKELGSPETVRAIANVNAKNKIYLLIPCHRVIASDGKLTGYGGGLWRKKCLLDFEKSETQPMLNFNL